MQPSALAWGIVLADFAPEPPRPRPDDFYALPAAAEAKRRCLKLNRQESQRAYAARPGAIA
jgi:hypothetical protein